MNQESDSLFRTLVGDGRPLVLLMAGALTFAGGGALFLSLTGDFLPHDVAFLDMQPEALCALNECRIVHFMIHDRASFGAVLISLAVLYAWLALFPLRQGESWAWWTLTLTCLTGFASFLCYLGYGYLDTWHGLATLLLLPVAVAAIRLTKAQCRGKLDLAMGGTSWCWRSGAGIGRVIWIVSSLGLVGAGATIMLVGMTQVFVPSDLSFIGYTRDELQAINPRLIPLIAHDRAGFGGGVFTTGLFLLIIIWKAAPSRHVWQAVTLASAIGFAVGIGVHYPIGYLDFEHLFPAWLGGLGMATGAVLTHGAYSLAPKGCLLKKADFCVPPALLESAHYFL